MLQERKKKSAEELLEMQEVIKKLKARMTEVCLDSDLKVKIPNSSCLKEMV